ncbi:MAG: AAA family ATPase, partial [bacterium]|nr:AAA family ATPase [bacterium]
MTSSQWRQDQVNSEQAVNEEYLHKAKRQQRSFLDRAHGVSTPRNTIWSASTPRIPGSARASIGPLTGRVALDYEDPDLGASFYVGDYYTELDQAVVISWIAKSARLLFAGRDSSWHDPDPRRRLAGRRFRHDGDVIVDFRDDVEPSADAATVFASRSRTLDVARPPARRAPDGDPATTTEPTPPIHTPDVDPAGDPPRPEEPTITSAAPPSQRRTEDVPEPPHKPIEAEPPRNEPPPVGAPTAPTPPAADRLRARGLVMEEIAKPRSDRLHSVLRTLQPDQHRLVTSPATEHLAVQGHPGTGKTIVATHRAAYLTHLDHDRDPSQAHVRLTSVGLVGPTDAWASYVRQVLDDIGAHGVEVISMQRLIRELSGRLDHPLHHKDERYFHSDAKNVVLANETARRLKADLSRVSDRKRRMQIVAEGIIDACRTDRSVADRLDDEQHRAWLAEARNYVGARRDKSYLLFLAGIGMSIDLCGNKGRYQHLIVDEVQDIRPAEWWILSTLLRRGGRWSLFGDMNQRRADHTSGTWE